MSRLPRRRPLLFTDLILSDRHHARFLKQDMDHLTDDEVWAERKLLELKLAQTIWCSDRTVILGSDTLTGSTEPTTRGEWVLQRLRSLATESQRRLRGRAA